jgi:hypothetical protein
MNVPAHVYAFVLAAICFIGAIVLVALNHTVPPELWQGGFLAAGAGAGIAIPSGTTPPVPVAPPPVVVPPVA